VALNDELIRELRRVVGTEDVLTSLRDLLAYEYDATVEKAKPEAVVFPASTAEVAAVVKLASQYKVPVTPRGAGTNLSGGTLPVRGGIVLEFSRMTRILEIDTVNQRAIVEPGVVNLDLQNTLAPLGYNYAPDPASQKSSTIAGNIGEDAGGPHCLKYGVTSNHVLGLEVVLADGQVVHLGGSAEDGPGYDLTGLLVGSEGTLGIVTKATLRIMRLPEAVKTLLAVYENLEDVGNTVSEIIAAGIIPATLEIMDRPVIKAVEDSVHAGYPMDAEAVLLIEVDGLSDGLERQADEIAQICSRNNVREVRVAKSPRNATPCGWGEGVHLAQWRVCGPATWYRTAPFPERSSRRCSRLWWRYRPNTGSRSATSPTRAMVTSTPSSCTTPKTRTRPGECTRRGARSWRPASRLGERSAANTG
jgi:glycolate oxidase